ncbi:MAG: hypothetical protein ACREBC_22075 [Pyrinomonadaceae bacterium]
MREKLTTRGTDPQKDKAWAALLASYDRVAKINHEEDARLFKLAGAYIAAAVAISGWLIPHLQKPDSTIPSLILSIGSVANTFYLIFYSYHSTHLTLSAHFLNGLARASKKFVGEHSDYLRWEGYSSSGGRRWTRTALILLKTSWRLAPLVMAIFLGYFALDTCKRIEYVVALSSLRLSSRSLQVRRRY